MDLVREKLAHVAVDQDVDAFAKRCADELNYTKLVGESGATSIHNLVVEAFARLGIEPFSNRSVEAYKKAKAVTRQELPGLLALFSLACLACVVVAVPVFFAITESRAWLAAIPIPVGIFAVTVVATLDQSRKTFEWRSFPPSNSPEPIPEFALQTALDVRGALREPLWKHSRTTMTFQVHCLTDSSSKIHDPFLVLEVAGRLYYLEVWNEPDFKQRRD